MTSATVEKYSLHVPAMYADHHVTEVRRILFEMPGVEDVYASSSFHEVEIFYDPVKISPEQIHQRIAEAGYLGEFAFPVETGKPVNEQSNGDTFFRHTAVYEQIRQSVSFGQVVPYLGRPLWPCPGMGVIRTKGMEE